MNEKHKSITKINQAHIHRVTFTEEDFMNMDILRGGGDHFTVDFEIPPADRNVFDDDYCSNTVATYVPLPAKITSNDDVIRIPSLDSNVVPPYVPLPEKMTSNDDAIRIPSLDANLKWSPDNPIVTLPNIGQTQLANAVSGGETCIQSAQLSILEELKRMTKQAKCQRTSSKSAMIPESGITNYDVICERGGKSNRHVGTKLYRGMVEKYKSEYQSLNSKTDKTNLSRKIIAQIQQKGGRFLKKADDGNYFILSRVETTKKVSQAMREKKILKWTSATTST